MDPTAYPAILVGHTETGYVILDFSCNVVEEKRNVIFDKTMYYSDIKNVETSERLKPVYAENEPIIIEDYEHGYKVESTNDKQNFKN